MEASPEHPTFLPLMLFHNTIRVPLFSRSPCNPRPGMPAASYPSFTSPEDLVLLFHSPIDMLQGPVIPQLLVLGRDRRLPYCQPPVEPLP
jgi:hypothetical protein